MVRSDTLFPALQMGRWAFPDTSPSCFALHCLNIRNKAHGVSSTPVSLLLPVTCSYELGEKSRGTALWVKMKPEYGDQTEDLDMLILGEENMLCLFSCALP
jgi:hypothetical protein